MWRCMHMLLRTIEPVVLTHLNMRLQRRQRHASCSCASANAVHCGRRCAWLQALHLIYDLHN